MIRDSLDPGSKQVSLSVNASTNVIFGRRLVTNDFSIQNSLRGTNYLQGTNYIWLRLMRMGNTFVAHYSTNGLNWQYMWFTTVNMSNQVQVGLAVTAHHYGQLATAAFDNVSIGSLTPLPAHGHCRARCFCWAARIGRRLNFSVSADSSSCLAARW